MKAVFNTIQAEDFIESLEEFIEAVIEFKKEYDGYNANNRFSYPKYEEDKVSNFKDKLVNMLRSNTFESE